MAYPAVDYDFWDRGRHAPRPLKRQLRLGPEAFVYLYFGRPGVSKGLEFLLPAAALVRERLPASRLVMLLARDPAGPYRKLAGDNCGQAGREHEDFEDEDHGFLAGSTP